jgi:glucoamylase
MIGDSADGADDEDTAGGGSEDDNVGAGAHAAHRATGAEIVGGAAFGAPGIAPTWSSSDKDYVSTALGGSRLWATVGHGIINEIYWPSTGQPQVRDFGFYLVGDGSAAGTHWVDLKRVRDYSLATPGPYRPALSITHHGDDYDLALEVLPDPRRDALLVRFNISGPYRLVVIVAPHLGSTGRHNSAWVDDGYAYARHGDFCMCLAASHRCSS